MAKYAASIKNEQKPFLINTSLEKLQESTKCQVHQAKR